MHRSMIHSPHKALTWKKMKKFGEQVSQLKIFFHRNSSPISVIREKNKWIRKFNISEKKIHKKSNFFIGFQSQIREEQFDRFFCGVELKFLTKGIKINCKLIFIKPLHPLLGTHCSDDSKDNEKFETLVARSRCQFWEFETILCIVILHRYNLYGIMQPYKLYRICYII